MPGRMHSSLLALGLRLQGLQGLRLDRPCGEMILDVLHSLMIQRARYGDGCRSVPHLEPVA